MSAARTVGATYADPVDVIWTETARRLGMTIVRDDTAYASWDGRGGLTIGTAAELDEDDCVAQMVLHEICHAAVEGPTAWSEVDWGLENADDRDRVREYACLRVQAALVDRHGLRGLLASTTDWRAYWDQLPADALAPGPDPAIALARSAWDALRRGPWWEPLEAALTATSAIARAAQPFAPTGSLWRVTAGRGPAGTG